MKQVFAIVLAMAVITTAFALQGCAPKGSAVGKAFNLAPQSYQTVSVDPKGLLTVNTIAIPHASFSKEAQRAVGDGDRFNALLDDSVNSGLDLKVVTPDKKISAKQVLITPGAASLPEALRYGKSLSADGVLVATITTYSEREGGRAGAEQGAALGFSVALYRVSDGREIWSGRYFNHDEALSENLLSIKNKLGATGSPTWRSAEDLMRDGLSRAVRDLQSRRLSAFQGQG